MIPSSSQEISNLSRIFTCLIQTEDHDIPFKFMYHLLKTDIHFLRCCGFAVDHPQPVVSIFKDRQQSIRAFLAFR